MKNATEEDGYLRAAQAEWKKALKALDQGIAANKKYEKQFKSTQFGDSGFNGFKDSIRLLEADKREVTSEKPLLSDFENSKGKPMENSKGKTMKNNKGKTMKKVRNQSSELTAAYSVLTQIEKVDRMLDGVKPKDNKTRNALRKAQNAVGGLYDDAHDEISRIEKKELAEAERLGKSYPNSKEKSNVIEFRPTAY